MVDEFDAQRKLSDRDFAIFTQEASRKSRNVGVTYALFLFFGLLGVHRFYLGKWITGLAYPVLTVSGWMFFLGGLAAVMSTHPGTTVEESAGAFGAIGIIAWVVLGLLAIWDLITIPRQVRKFDEKVRSKLLDKFVQHAEAQRQEGSARTAGE